MPRTYYLNWRSLCALATCVAVTMTAPPVVAGDDPPICDGISRPSAPIEGVTQSWPLVERNAFAADGSGAEYLSVTLLIAVSRGDGPPCLAPYYVEKLEKSAEGELSGSIVPTSMDNPVFFDRIVVIDPAMIVDWYYAPTFDALRFGHFQTRQQLGQVNADVLIDAKLSPDPVPPTWQ